MTRKLPTVGILGGGQLARMLALAAAPLGIRTLVVDGSADACAGQVTDLVVADWFDDALSLIHISEPTRPSHISRMPSSA